MGLTDMRPWLLPLAAAFGVAGGLLESPANMQATLDVSLKAWLDYLASALTKEPHVD